MRHKIGKKYLKIACSWILIFSICFLSWNTVPAFEEDTFISEAGTYEDSADEDQNQQPDDIVSDGEESDQEPEEQEPEEQEPEDQIPDSLKVEVLDAEIKKEFANGEEPYTDRVEYVDETGNPIDGAPAVISLGKIEDHISLFGTDKNYEFKSARVDGADIVFIGKYKDNLYYSTDGIDADRMEDRQKLVMTYAEIKDAQDNEDNSPDQTPEETPDQTPEETPDQTPEETPDQAPEETPDQTPEETPDQTPEETPDQTPEETPDQTPEETPDQTPEETPDQTPEETPDQTPDQIPDTEEPGQMSVQELEEELQKDLANGEEPFTDRVEYIDETGNLIDGAPETICLGRIKDHVSLLIAGKNYEFKSARIDGTDCVFIGKCKDDLYYSTDGIHADRMKDDQKLVITSAEIKDAQDEEDSSDQTPDEEAPEQISVQSLDEELERSVETGNETSTDRVEYVDADGNSIAGAPTRIDFGPIKDHVDLSIVGKNLEFKSATVNGKNCVYIGIYKNTIYYSTDGVIAIKLEDGQKLRMAYQEYYNITIKEVIPGNGSPGTITKREGSIDTPIDITKPIRVNAGKDLTITVIPGIDTSKPTGYVDNRKRYKITSVKLANGNEIEKKTGDAYGATYTMSFKQDDTITITYDTEGVYRVTINTKGNDGTQYIHIEHSVEKGWKYLPDKDQIMYEFTNKDVNSMNGNYVTFPEFHTIKGQRLIHMVLNGITIAGAGNIGGVEVPTEINKPLATRAGIFDLDIKMTEDYGLSHKSCSYAYQIQAKSSSGKWTDLNFDLAPHATKEQALTVRLYTNQKRSGEGLDVVMWDRETKQLVPVNDNDTFDMEPIKEGLKTPRNVRIFFGKCKNGYEFTNNQVSCKKIGTNTLDDSNSDAAWGSISEMNETSLGEGKTTFNIYKETWKEAKEAAEKAGYKKYAVWGGMDSIKNTNWVLYGVSFESYQNDIYVHYNSGAGEGVLPKNAVVNNIPDNPETDNQNRPMHSYGKRTMGTSFPMGEGWQEPTCEGYEFLGWKLKQKNGQLSDRLYQHNEIFTISDENYMYANNNNLPVFGWTNKSGYQIVAQWKKTGTRDVEVKHYLKVPDGNEYLEKTTAGMISFAKDNETVTAIGKPEPDGTFPGYVFDESDGRNTLEKTVTNDGSTEKIVLNLYYKPTVLTVSKTVTGYDMEPNREYSFTIQANAPAGASLIKDGQVYIKKGEETVTHLSFTDNKATFTLKKDETVQIFCLSTGWNYTISETDPGSNYKTTYQINEGTVKEGRNASFDLTDASASVSFTNESTISPPETGRTLQNNGYKILLIVVLAAGFVCMVFFKKMKRNIRS